MAFKHFFLILSFLGLAACTPEPNVDDDLNLIGSPLEKVSSLTNVQGQESEQVVIFDETVRKIHQFNLSDMSYLKSFSVKKPDAEHVVLSHDKGHYVIDICEKNITIFSRAGLAQHNPIQMQGKPLSAAFRSDLNLFVIYDDLNSVGIVQLNPQGEVQKTWVGGSLLLGSASITSGDLLATGQLILGLSDKSIAVIDVGQSLTQQKWVFTSFASGLSSNIAWLAPVRDNNNQIFVRAASDLAIIDLQTKSIVTSGSVSNGRFEKFSKATDGHVVVRSTVVTGQLTLYFAKNSQIHSRHLNKQDSNLLSSYLNLTEDKWSYVEFSAEDYYQFPYFNDIDFSKTGRILKSIRISDMLSLQRSTLADTAQLLLSPNYVFSLFPSELGYAVRTDIKTGTATEAKFFNVGHM